MNKAMFYLGMMITVCVLFSSAAFADQIFLDTCSDLSSWSHSSDPSKANVSVGVYGGHTCFILQSKVIDQSLPYGGSIPVSCNAYLFPNADISTLGYENIFLSYDLATAVSEPVYDTFALNGRGAWYNQPIDSVTTDLAWQTRTINLTGLSALADNNAVNFKFDLTANFLAGGHTCYAYVDNIRLTGTVTPEPASMALFGIGSAVLALMRRRKTGSNN